MEQSCVGKQRFAGKHVSSTYYSAYSLQSTVIGMSFEELSEMSPLFVAADEEAFEDNSEEYIRRDLEGSGMGFVCFF